MPAALAADPIRAHAPSNLRAILSRPGFRHLFAVRLTSQLGDGWFQAGLAGSLLFSPEKNATPLAIATAFLILLVPYSAIGPFVGVFLDRWSRRSVLFFANVARAVLVLPTALLIWQSRPSSFFVMLALAIIAINRFVLAGLSAAQPHVVTPAQLVTANSVATTLGAVAFSIGLGSATLCLHFAGAADHPYAVVAATGAIAYAVSAVIAVVSFAIDELGPDDHERATGSIGGAVVATFWGMIEGLRHLARRPGAAAAMTVQAGHRLLYGVLALATILLYRNYFNAGGSLTSSLTGLGQVIVAGGVGTLLASFVTPPVTRRIGGWRWVAGLMAGLAVLVPVLALPFISMLLLAAVLLTSLASQSTKIVVDTALQLECADEFRGRVFSCNDTAFNVSFVLGLFIGALALPDDGHAPLALLGVGAGYAILAGWYGRVAGRNARRSGDDIQVAAHTG